jgi:GYF domain 2
MTYYFIKDHDKELGPFTTKQLKTKSIKKDTPVWFAGLEEWTTASEVYELKELFVKGSCSKINRIWNNKLLKQQFKKVTYQLIDIRARKNLY